MMLILVLFSGPSELHVFISKCRKTKTKPRTENDTLKRTKKTRSGTGQFDLQSNVVKVVVINLKTCHFRFHYSKCGQCLHTFEPYLV